jgi:hypothetical protein
MGAVMRQVPFMLAVAALASIASPAGAQMTIDVAKITCDQFRMYKVANPNYIAIWIAGYYGGKRDSTIVEVEALKDAFDKVNDYCITHLDMPVMQAARTVLGK